MKWKEEKSTEIPNDALTTIFNNRVALLEKNLSPIENQLISGKIRATINELDDNFFLVRKNFNPYRD